MVQVKWRAAQTFIGADETYFLAASSASRQRAESVLAGGASSSAKPLISRKTIQPPNVSTVAAMPRPIKTFRNCCPEMNRNGYNIHIRLGIRSAAQPLNRCQAGLVGEIGCVGQICRQK